MSQKIGVEHLARSAVIYVRQSTMTQVLGNLESQKRQYALARHGEERRLRFRDGDRRGPGPIRLWAGGPAGLPASRSRGLRRRRWRRVLHRGVAAGAQRAGLASSDRSLRDDRRAGHRSGRRLRPAPDERPAAARPERHDVRVRAQSPPAAWPRRTGHEGRPRRASLHAAARLLLERGRNASSSIPTSG